MADGTTVWIYSRCEAIVVANAPKYSVDLHYVRWLKNLFHTLAALVSQFVCFSCFIDVLDFMNLHHQWFILLTLLILLPRCNAFWLLLYLLMKVLYEQFKFFLNFFFLVMACSQFIPEIRVGYLYTYWAPLVGSGIIDSSVTNIFLLNTVSILDHAITSVVWHVVFVSLNTFWVNIVNCGWVRLFYCLKVYITHWLRDMAMKMKTFEHIFPIG